MWPWGRLERNTFLKGLNVLCSQNGRASGKKRLMQQETLTGEGERVMELEVSEGHRWKLWFLGRLTLVCAAKSARYHTMLDLE